MKPEAAIEFNKIIIGLIALTAGRFLAHGIQGRSTSPLATVGISFFS
jgi:hypothetical protein